MSWAVWVLGGLTVLFAFLLFLAVVAIVSDSVGDDPRDVAIR